MQKRLSQHFQFQVNYQLSEDLADDDNERDPFTYRYAVANNFKPDYGFSDRMERHRFNAFGLWQAPWGIEFSPLISFHTPQPISVGVTPADRVLANGYIIRRNSLWKDNTFFALDFRAAKSFRLSERFRLQFIVDAFNLTNRANPKHPETTSLLFNFDGTVQSGLGDPRQGQLGLRLTFLPGSTGKTDLSHRFTPIHIDTSQRQVTSQQRVHGGYHQQAQLGLRLNFQDNR